MRLRIFIFITIITFSAMLSDCKTTDEVPYKVISTEKGLEYLKAHNLTIQDNSLYSINSNKAFIYLLPTGEAMLMPTNFDSAYPSILFKNKEAFLYFAQLDSFPIGLENMTWFEKNNDNIKQFWIKTDFYGSVLHNVVAVQIPFQKLDDIKVAFFSIQSLLNSPKQSSKAGYESEAEEMVYSFGLAVLDYLMRIKNLKIEIENRYEKYNPAAYPMAVFDGKRIDVLSKCIRYLTLPGDYQFGIFSKKVHLTE